MASRNRRVQLSDMSYLNPMSICLLICILLFDNGYANALPRVPPNANDVLQQENRLDNPVVPPGAAGKVFDQEVRNNINGLPDQNLGAARQPLRPLVNQGQNELHESGLLRQGLGQAAGIKKHMEKMPLMHKNVLLATHEDCREDVEELCDTATLRKNNFAVLDCLQGDYEIQSRVSEKCQHLIWTYKQNLTKDDRFDAGASEVCATVISKIDECHNLPEGQGLRIPCLIEHMDNISDRGCLKFLKKMANLVFADYRLVYHFMENCRSDIETQQCGRLDEPTSEKQHLQGNTILCLARKIGALNEKCKKQVLRVAELQSDDYHLDRPLYYACREARERFCEETHAGGGKVFDCLLKHKNNMKMEEECKDLLTVRQQLMAEDVKVKKTFYEACKNDMRHYHCMTSENTADGHAARSIVLLCLENALKKDKKVSPTCIAEMTEVRRSLMEDYQITPEVAIRCELEINHFCNGGEERGGKTIHCLLNYANPRELQKLKKDGDPEFRDQCKAALEDLLKEADVGSDYTVDKVLADACQEVLENDCQDVWEDGVINCLMEKVDSDHMTDECEDRLLEIQYFIVRDFKLDNELYKQCHKDAVELCSAPEDWVDVNQQSASNSPMIFPCLYRHMKHDEEGSLSRRCEHEVKRVMRRRAKRIDLEPEVEDACLTDLGALCSDQESYGKGEEMNCLQDHLEEIENDQCEELVRQFTIDEDEDLDLDTVLMRACTPMIKKFCDELLKHDAEASEVMDCLVENKNHHEMNEKCKAGIEHHQLIQLKDFRFSHKFKESCKDAVVEHCKGKTKKTEIVSCLSCLSTFDTWNITSGVMFGRLQRITLLNVESCWKPLPYRPNPNYPVFR